MDDGFIDEHVGYSILPEENAARLGGTTACGEECGLMTRRKGGGGSRADQPTTE
jgi:hypothetical protein